MRGILVFIGLILFTSWSYAQEKTWELLGQYEQKNIDAWDVNPLGEIIIASRGSLYTLDSEFNLLFTQSRKMLGTITKIDARHSLKTLMFSDNQQMIAFTDNTLTFQEGKVDLGSLGVGYATLVCYSDQTSRFWVYDEENSRLLRFEGIKSSVKQSEISNLTGITRQEFPQSITESQNQLIMFYQGSGIFIFDYYGSLLQKFSYPEVIQVYPSDNYLYLLTDKNIIKVHRKTGEEEAISLPLENIQDIRVHQNSIYLKNKDGINKYSIIPSE